MRDQDRHHRSRRRNRRRGSHGVRGNLQLGRIHAHGQSSRAARGRRRAASLPENVDERHPFPIMPDVWRGQWRLAGKCPGQRSKAVAAFQSLEGDEGDRAKAGRMRGRRSAADLKA